MNNHDLIKKTQESIDKQINERGYATIVDVLLDIGYLTKQNYEKWRLGKIDYLERVCITNLNKLQLILKTAHNYATKKKYEKSITFYKKYKSKKKIKLRFTASNNEKIEQLYSTHFVLKCNKNIKSDETKQNEYINKLKDIILEFGTNYLRDNPFDVYKELLKIKNVNKKLCSSILYVLVNDVINIKDDFENVDVLSKKIQDTCDLSLKASNDLANIFSTLYSKENLEEFLKEKDNKLNIFLQNKIVTVWNGFSIWRYSGGYLECFYEGDISILPNKNVLKNKDFKMYISNNPYATINKIQDHFINEVCEYLDSEFHEYCTCEKYYEPVVEEFYFERSLEDWYNKNGFNIIKCNGRGYDGGYTPDF